MNSNDERSIVPLDVDRLIGGCHAQGNNVASVLNSTRSTIKIDSLSIELGIVKEKGDAQKCRHFSIRGYVAGMRERGSSNLLPFTEQLPPMDVPHFRYWLCKGCRGTANASHEIPLISVCDQCVLARPSTRSCPPQECDGVAVLPFGEGTSAGVKTVDSRNDDESILAAFGANESRSSQEIPANANVSQELTKSISIGNRDANGGAQGKNESNNLRYHEDPQEASIVNTQPNQSGQQNDYPNEHPKRKARKVRLLKELLCGNTEIQQQKKENSAPLATSSQIKRKMLHDHDDQEQRSVDITTKKAKGLKGNSIAKNSMVEHSRNPEGRETINKYEWNKHGTQRSSILAGKVGSDAMAAWRSIFSDMGRTDNHVKASCCISNGRQTEPYSNFMAPPEQKISSNQLKTKLIGEHSRNKNADGSKAKDRYSDMELGLGLSLNYDSQSSVRYPPSILNQTSNQVHSRKSGFFLRESSIPHRIQSDSRSNEGLVHDVSNRHAPRTPYSQLPYGSCSGHQKLDFSDPYKRNTGVRGCSDVMRPNSHQRHEKMFSIGRSDEREVIELMAKNQYERSLCEARNKNGIPKTSGFCIVNMNERIPSPMRENLGPTTMRNPVSSFTVFDGLTQKSQKQPSSGVCISDSRYHHVSKGNNKIAQTHFNTPTNMQVLEPFNMYNNGAQQNVAAYAKYSDNDKGKSRMDLDLNVMAPNVIEEHNNLEYHPYTANDERMNMNPKNNMCSLDSSYSNEAIPAMQLLSLMDAGKSSPSFNMEGRKLLTKPLSPCHYSHSSSVMMPDHHFPYSGLRPGVQKPIGSSNSSSLGFGSPQTSVFRSNQNVKLPVYHRPQEDSYVFHLPWHATEDRNEFGFGPRFESSGTEICTINQNPADFSTPGADNVYMINVEDPILKGESSQKGKFASEKSNGPKWQKR